MEENICTSFLVGIDIRKDGEEASLVVGTQVKHTTNIVNVFTGQEALDLFHKLTDTKPKEETNG